MALARRLPVAPVALAGLAGLAGLLLALVGAWFVVILGPSGTATFTATSSQPAVLLGPQIVDRVAVPVTVTASADSGPVFLGAAVPQDAVEAVGQSRHEVAVVAQLPARALQLEGQGGQPMPDPSGYHVWRATGEGTVTLAPDTAPQAVLAVATKGGPVTVTVSYTRTAWFLEALLALLVGAAVLAAAGVWLWRHGRWGPRKPGAVAEAAPDRVAVPAPADARSEET